MDPDIRVDRTKCIGAGMCALTAPDVFTQDDEGLSELRPGRTGPAGPLVREAVRVCPVGAITVRDPAARVPDPEP
ncbi:ferredoxin [Streptomyces sp. NPDC050504]|uniref:ferredoxin n=1 Tax=Streptomyces sp. NPDC050504 TaxID=3365618 RepID=UPI0037901A67